MAAPPHVTTKALTGKFLMSKTLSDDADEILRLQGVSWFKRRAIATFPLVLAIKHFTDDAGIEHLDAEQGLSGTLAISSSTDNRILDWEDHQVHDSVFGFVTDKTRRLPTEQITDDFFKTGWTQDTVHDGIIFSDSWSTPDKNKYTWRAVQAWGFEEIKGERRHVRYTIFTSSDKKDGPIQARFVYDYLGTV